MPLNTLLKFSSFFVFFPHEENGINNVYRIELFHQLTEMIHVRCLAAISGSWEAAQ